MHTPIAIPGTDHARFAAKEARRETDRGLSVSERLGPVLAVIVNAPNGGEGREGLIASRNDG